MHLSGNLGLVQSRPHAEYAVDTPGALHRRVPGQQHPRAVPELPSAQHHEQPKRVRDHGERYPSRVTQRDELYDPGPDDLPRVGESWPAGRSEQLVHD